MNFLSHFYLNYVNDDHYYNVGLTLPDILTIISRKIRVSKRVLQSFEQNQLPKLDQSLISSMIIHYEVDQWFHRLPFFIDSMTYVENEFKKTTGKKLLHFHSHVLIEILIDRFLLVHIPGIAEQFYYSYQQIDPQLILPFFNQFEGFNEDQFLEFIIPFSTSTFLKEYTDYSRLPVFLERISRRINYYVDPGFYDQKAISLFEQCYLQLEPGISKLLREAKLKFNKQQLMTVKE